jgi:hypothetical protein
LSGVLQCTTFDLSGVLQKPDNTMAIWERTKW